MRVFKIVRDIGNLRFTKGSDSLVVTQFDSGCSLSFELLDHQKPMDLKGCQAIIVFKNQETGIEWGEKVVIRQPLSLTSSPVLTYELNRTEEAGEYVGILTLIDVHGCQVSTAPFVLTVLPHLTTQEKLQHYWGIEA